MQSRDKRKRKLCLFDCVCNQVNYSLCMKEEHELCKLHRYIKNKKHPLVLGLLSCLIYILRYIENSLYWFSSIISRILDKVRNNSVKEYPFIIYRLIWNKIYNSYVTLPIDTYNYVNRHMPVVNNWVIKFWLMFPVRKGSNVKSVLHISIISHKQYMITRVLRKKGIKSAFLALNTSGNDYLNIGYDYSIPINLGPVKRLLKSLYYLWVIIPRYDVIHYHFNSLIIYYDNEFELDYLRRLRKIIII